MEYKPNVIRSSDQDFEDIIYGAPDRELSRYLSEKMTQASSFITEKTRGFFNRAKELYDEMSGEKARKRISDRMLINNISLSNERLSLLNRTTYNLGIGNTDRRYLMVNPEMYTAKKKERISGFNGAYEDEDKYVDNPYWKRDYLRATKGLLNVAEERMTYTNTVKDEFNDLAFSEQIIIKRNWELSNRLIVDDIDITELVD